MWVLLPLMRYRLVPPLSSMHVRCALHLPVWSVPKTKWFCVRSTPSVHFSPHSFSMDGSEIPLKSRVFARHVMTCDR